MSTTYIDKGAVISKCGCYRYRLWREWRGPHDPKHWSWSIGVPRFGTPKACVFVMLNPSTADGRYDDATIRNCVGLAQAWSYERLEVVNLFAYRATDPRQIMALDLDTAVGPDNRDWVEKTLENAGLVICAWGNHGSYLGQDQTMLGWLDSVKTFCLGLTSSGNPRHPLYMPRDLVLRRFNPKVIL
jgi:hypothetical protein